MNRRFLYFGIFLVAIGGVLVAADIGRVDSATIATGLRLWPLAFVAIGLAIVARRTRFSLPSGMLAAAVPGLLIGGGFAIAPRVALDCAATGGVATSVAHDGVFDGPARVTITTACGALDVSTAPGGAWHFDDGNTAGRAAIVNATSRSLSIDSGREDGLHLDDVSRDRWHLTLPTTPIDDLSFDVNAGQGRIALPGATVGHLALTANAAEASVDLSETALTSLTADVNAGRLSVRLASTADVVGSMDVNAASLEVCIPADLGLRIHHTGVLSGFTVEGRHQPGADWLSPNYGSAAHRADLTVDVNLGNVALNPIGGCK